MQPDLKVLLGCMSQWFSFIYLLFPKARLHGVSVSAVKNPE